MAPCGARWMYSSLGTSDGSKAHASSPPILTTIIKLDLLTVFLLSEDLHLSVRIFVSRNEAIEQLTHGRHHPSPRGEDRMHETRRRPQVR